MKTWMSIPAALGMAALVITGLSVSARAELPAPGTVTATVLARGTYGEFKVSSAQTASFDFSARSKAPMDVVVRRHDYLAGSRTGWHKHPGPIFITVTAGQLTVYEWDDPTCTGRILQPGEGYVDSGHGHLIRNETAFSAQDVSVITAPTDGAPFREELPALNPYCGF